MAGTKLYTRSGDNGQTRLGAGRRVPKTNGAIEVIGEIDELMNAVGLARTGLPSSERELDEFLVRQQKNLLTLKEDIGQMGRPNLSAGCVEELERQIDAYGPWVVEKDPGKIAGANEASARLDSARGICRRLERHLNKAGLPQALHLKYINRLSDLLYAAARYMEYQKESHTVTAAAAPAAPVIRAAAGRLPLKGVKVLIDAIEKVAEQKGLQLVIAVCNDAGRPIAVHVMDDAFIASYDIAVNKAFTAVSLKMPTKDLAELCKPGGSLYGLQYTNGGRIVIFGGGVTLTDTDGRILGGLGVSGSTAEIDTMMGDIGKEIFDKLLAADKQEGGIIFGNY